MAQFTDPDLATAEARGRALMNAVPRARAATYDRASGRVTIDLVDGCSYAFPADRVRDLRGGSPAALSRIVVEGLGFNLHWPLLDVDVYIPALICGLFGACD